MSALTEAAERLGIELMPWQIEIGERILAGDRILTGDKVVFVAGRRAAIKTLKRVIREARNDCDCGDSSHHYCDRCDGMWCPERGCCDGPGMHQSPYAPDESKEGRE